MSSQNKIQLINPKTKQRLEKKGDFLIDSTEQCYPVIKNIPRFCEASNYADSFGFQWNKFEKIQLDGESNSFDISKRRFFQETNWTAQNLDGKDILEVGSGAGRFSKVILLNTSANLWTIDYSNAVEVNYKNNSSIRPENFNIFQASIYEMPFPDNSFDYIFCFGVLQHTPNFELSLDALVSKLKRGGELVVDFYPINGWWTKIHAKYILRPITKRMDRSRLLRLISLNIGWLIVFAKFLRYSRLSFLSRFLPIVDLSTIPPSLTPEEFREWVVLDTFDMFSPEHDHPRRIKDVKSFLEKKGLGVTFAGKVKYSEADSAAVVRGIKQ